MSFPETASEVEPQEPDVNTPDDSSHGDEGAKESTFDVVQSALGVEPEESPASTGEENDVSGDSKDEPLPEEISDEEMSAYPKNSQRRIRQLVDEKRGFSEEVEKIRPKAEAADKIFGYMRENNIEPSDLDSALNITRLVNSDPRAALEALTPIYQELAQRAGAILPNDLQELVRQGYITEAHARELTQAKSQAENATRQREADEAKRQRDALQSRQTVAEDTANDWSSQRQKSDPDWHLKQSQVHTEIELELRRAGPQGFPKNAQETKALCDKALATVEARLKEFLPKPKHIDPVRDLASGNGGSAPAPKSSLEAMENALGTGVDY